MAAVTAWGEARDSRSHWGQTSCMHFAAAEGVESWAYWAYSWGRLDRAASSGPSRTWLAVSRHIIFRVQPEFLETW